MFAVGVCDRRISHGTATPDPGDHGRGLVSAGRSDHVTCPCGDSGASIGPRAENDNSDSGGPLEHKTDFIGKQITTIRVRATDTRLTSLSDISLKS